MELVEETPYRFRVDPHGDMRVPGVVFTSKALLPDAQADRSLDQVVNVATLPGIVGASYAMPDMHWGYGFPIGGVAATDVRDGGVVSPGGVGFDINCGVRLLGSSLRVNDVRPRLKELVHQLFRDIPSGTGQGGRLKLSHADLDDLLTRGPRWAVELGMGSQADLDQTEEGGRIPGAAPSSAPPASVSRASRSSP